MKKLKLIWISITAVVFAEVAISPMKIAHASWGAEIPFLIKILAESIQQVKALQAIIGTTRETVSILEEMNRGVKEVLRLAHTAHIPLPKQVYDTAKTIDDATKDARNLYGKLPDHAPVHMKAHYQSGVEGLFLSQDAFEYSKFLDDKGEHIKSSAITASQSSATRLTAESLGVLLHAVSHSNRIQAKSLEVLATKRIEDAAKESADLESFIHTHNAIERDLKSSRFAPLNSFGNGEMP